MADTGWKFPGTVVNRPILTHTNWTNPGNAIADDAADAVVSLPSSGESDGLAASNFDFSAIPVGATIVGIEVRIGDYIVDDQTTIAWSIIRLILADDSDGAQNKTSAFIDPLDFRQIDEGGGPTDLWTETLVRADVQDVDFGFFISLLTGGFAAAVSVDFLQMKIFYTVPSVPGDDRIYSRRNAGLMYV